MKVSIIIYQYNIDWELFSSFILFSKQLKYLLLANHNGLRNNYIKTHIKDEIL